MASRQDRLLAALQRKTPAPATSATPVAALAVAAVPESVPLPAARSTGKRIGKPVQFWLHEEDRRLIRELAAWLAGQGIRPTDSMVVRAALRVSKPGAAFLEAYRRASQLDGRLKQLPE